MLSLVNTPSIYTKEYVKIKIRIIWEVIISLRAILWKDVTQDEQEGS